MTKTQATPPAMMKAAAIKAFGTPDVVHTEDVSVPKPGKHEVLIRVDVAGVGSWDPWLVSGGLAKGKAHFPQIFGSDGEGTIVAVGEKVKRRKVGERVYGWGFGSSNGGFFAEYAALPEDNVAPIPEGTKPEEAGALAVAGITALEGLDLLKLEPGDKLLLIGASGGVGHVALQLAKRMGADVFALASGKDGVDLVRRLGADVAVDGKHGDAEKVARKFAPDGFDAALVFAGSKDGWKVLTALMKKGGCIAYPNGVEPVPHARPGVKVKAYDGESTPAAFARLNALIGDEPFHIELSRVYPLEKAAEALRDVEKHHVGKLAIRIH